MHQSRCRCWGLRPYWPQEPTSAKPTSGQKSAATHDDPCYCPYLIWRSRPPAAAFVEDHKQGTREPWGLLSRQSRTPSLSADDPPGGAGAHSPSFHVTDVIRTQLGGRRTWAIVGRTRARWLDGLLVGFVPAGAALEQIASAAAKKYVFAAPAAKAITTRAAQ
jgi:hypothetical protein